MFTKEQVDQAIDWMMGAPSEAIVDAIVANMDDALLAAVHAALEPDCVH